MENCQDFKKEIENKLGGLINSNYCLLDVPDHDNLGDHIITQGEFDFLKNNKFNMKYCCPYNSFDEKMVDKQDLILLQGGGNFGDLWFVHQIFREKIIQTFKNNKIIILPQSVYFKNKENLEKSIKIFSEHKNLTICARDIKSFEFLKKYFVDNKILLVPDMAFYLDVPQIQPKKEIKRILFINRTDKELKENINLDFINNVEIHDWPTIESPPKFTHKFENRDFYVKEGVSFLSNYDLIISNRLHGSILATILGIPNILLDNSYNKSKNFYNTWMEDISHCNFAENLEELKTILREKYRIGY
ncbi:polysaccharide pyruvyl transferase family protein [Candidatus Woesearchaeota archaeon]|nr:polysaccharide pyruvyl transferase family protein [Candidatus Woesearchaeota archaeon]